MGARGRTALLVLLALPLLSVPFGLAAGKPQETLDGTVRTWHGDTFSTPVDVGAGVDTTVAGLVALEAPGQAVQALAGRKVRATASGATARSRDRRRRGDDGGDGRGRSGTKSVAVLLFNFSNDRHDAALDDDDVRGVVFDNADSVGGLPGTRRTAS